MMAIHTLRRERVLNAGVDAVFACFADPLDLDRAERVPALVS
jgi:hypothetical protein